MKSAPFELIVPHSLDEALTYHDGETKILAGGQSLVPLMNFRLARPTKLVDLNRVSSLDYIRTDASGGLMVGAMTRQRTLERSADVRRIAPLVSDVLPWVGHPPIRNRGTLGGSLAHADSAAELCLAALALDSTVVASSARGQRQIPIDELFVGPFTTSLSPDEILTEVRFPPNRFAHAFEEVALRRGDFALVAVATLLQFGADSRIAQARLAYLSMGPTPLRARQTETWLIGRPATEDVFAEAASRAVAELEPVDDLHASREYRTHVARGLTQRTLARSANGR